MLSLISLSLGLSLSSTLSGVLELDDPEEAPPVSSLSMAVLGLLLCYAVSSCSYSISFTELTSAFLMLDLMSFSEGLSLSSTLSGLTVSF